MPQSSRWFWMTILFWGNGIGPAGAIEIVVKPTVCPACETASDSHVAYFGVRDHCLDGEPRWIDGKPGLWPSSLCPNCRFPLTSDLSGILKGENIKEALAYLKSAEYLALAKEFKSIFLMAKLSEKLGAEPVALGELYLRSTWQDGETPAHVERCLGSSLRCFKEYLARPADAGDDRRRIECLAGELERRLGDFEAAKRRFQQLAPTVDADRDDRRAMIMYELHLVSLKNREPQLLSTAKDWWSKEASGRRSNPR